MALNHPFQQQIIEKMFGVSTYTTDWSLGLIKVGTNPNTDTFATFDSGISQMALPTMELDTAENALGYPAVSNAAAFDYTIDATVDVIGWYVKNTAASTSRNDLAFHAMFGSTYNLISGDTLHWWVNTLVVEFYS
jgi:hypothetical protein